MDETEQSETNLCVLFRHVGHAMEWADAWRDRCGDSFVARAIPHAALYGPEMAWEVRNPTQDELDRVYDMAGEIPCTVVERPFYVEGPWHAGGL